VGWEQEFFVIDRQMYQRRPDLIATGRTLLGALPHRGQQTEAHYFARPPLRIRAMLRDAQVNTWLMVIWLCGTERWVHVIWMRTNVMMLFG